MADLSTTYLGLNLKSPLVVSASPLSEKIDGIRRMEEAGASAVVLFSLFEEQLRQDRAELETRLSEGTDSFSEALSFVPGVETAYTGPEEYLEHIQRAKKAVGIPVIASLNGASLGTWVEHAKKIQQAGADALELNIYHIPSDPDLPGSAVEETYIDILSAVRRQVTLPIAVKVGPYFSNMANMAKRLDDAGANGLVLFNRFYQPDMDIDTLEMRSSILLSSPMAMRLPLRWIAILHGRIKADLAATSGVHSGQDVIKMMMAGARATLIASSLLRYGVDRLRLMETSIREWMQEHEYESIRQMQGSMSQGKCPDPSAFERAHYVRALSTFPSGERS